MTTVYDHRDRPAEMLFHDSQKRVLSRVALHYGDGRIVEETQTSEIEETLPLDMLAQLNSAQLQSFVYWDCAKAEVGGSDVFVSMAQCFWFAASTSP